MFAESHVEAFRDRTEVDFSDFFFAFEELFTCRHFCVFEKCKKNVCSVDFCFLFCLVATRIGIHAVTKSKNKSDKRKEEPNWWRNRNYEGPLNGKAELIEIINVNH